MSEEIRSEYRVKIANFNVFNSIEEELNTLKLAIFTREDGREG